MFVLKFIDLRGKKKEVVLEFKKLTSVITFFEEYEQGVDIDVIELYEKTDSCIVMYDWWDYLPEAGTEKTYYECLSCDTHLHINIDSKICPICNGSHAYFLYSTEQDFKEYLKKIGA